MINLQIAGNKASSSSSAVNLSPANPVEEVLAADPFAVLLTQQFDAAVSLIPDTTESVTDDAQNLVGDIGDQQGDPATMLAAIALAEGRAQKTAGGAAETIEVEHGSLPSGAFRRMSTPAPLAEKSGQIENAASTITAAVASTALTGKSGPGENSVETIIAPAMSAIQAHTQLNNRTADNVQTINAPLDSNGWSDEFSQKISWMATQRHQVAELHLNPPNLGPLDVVLKISDHQATALFTSAHGAVRDAIEVALPRLREMLADNGIALGNATVSDQPPRDKGTEGFMNRDSDGAIRHGVSGNPSESSDMASAHTRTLVAHRHNGMVDTFA